MFFNRSRSLELTHKLHIMKSFDKGLMWRYYLFIGLMGQTEKIKTASNVEEWTRAAGIAKSGRPARKCLALPTTISKPQQTFNKTLSELKNLFHSSVLKHDESSPPNLQIVFNVRPSGIWSETPVMEIVCYRLHPYYLDQTPTSLHWQSLVSISSQKLPSAVIEDYQHALFQ